jgi:hypothetical protein
LVWRGGYLHAPNVETYPNVTRKYERLLSYLPQHYVNVLQYLCVVHRGMPDLLCYKAGTLKFIECKLDYEPLRDAQKQCIVKLQALGFPVEVWRVAQANVRYRRRRLDVLTDVHERLESQEPLTPHL